MRQSQLEVLANAVAALAFAAVAASILVPLGRSGRLRRNRLDLAAALVFVACSGGHAIQLTLRLTSEAPSRGSWSLAVWDALIALVALAYLQLRRVNGVPEEGNGIYEDACRRQHELAGQVMAANVREGVAIERAAAADQRLARVFAAAPVGMAVVDRQGCISRANPALWRILGRELVGASNRGLQAGSPDDHLVDLVDPVFRPAVEALLAEGADAQDRLELELGRPDGKVVYCHLTITPLGDDDGSLLALLEDVTEPRLAEERLEHLALHDPLTGLPNRVLLHTRAAAALRQANRTGCYVGCLIVDLDHFKVVNDSLGQAAGDEVLTTMALRLSEVVRPEDMVARMGGDEFCLLLIGLQHQAEAEVVAQRVRTALEGVVEVDGVRIPTSGSVGVAVAIPGDRATPETLVRDADLALCQAKAEGPSHTVVFNPGLREDARRRLLLEAI